MFFSVRERRRMRRKGGEEGDSFTVFLNPLNTFSETIAQFLKTLNTSLRRVNHFVKTTQILLTALICTDK